MRRQTCLVIAVAALVTAIVTLAPWGVIHESIWTLADPIFRPDGTIEHAYPVDSGHDVWLFGVELLPFGPTNLVLALLTLVATRAATRRARPWATVTAGVLAMATSLAGVLLVMSCPSSLMAYPADIACAVSAFVLGLAGAVLASHGARDGFRASALPTFEELGELETRARRELASTNVEPSYRDGDAGLLRREALATALAGAPSDDPAREALVRQIAELDAARRDEARVRLPLVAQASVASPCHEVWESIRGPGAVRTCPRCDETIFDLARMTVAAAEALITARTEASSEPVHLHRRADGKLMFADCEMGRRARRGRRVAIASATVLTLLVVPAIYSLGARFLAEHPAPSASEVHVAPPMPPCPPTTGTWSERCGERLACIPGVARDDLTVTPDEVSWASDLGTMQVGRNYGPWEGDEAWRRVVGRADPPPAVWSRFVGWLNVRLTDGVPLDPSFHARARAGLDECLSFGPPVRPLSEMAGRWEVHWLEASSDTCAGRIEATTRYVTISRAFDTVRADVIDREYRVVTRGNDLYAEGHFAVPSEDGTTACDLLQSWGLRTQPDGTLAGQMFSLLHLPPDCTTECSVAHALYATRAP